MGMNVRCPHCLEDKPLGASVCPKCTRDVSASQTAAGEFWSLVWLIVICSIIWNLIT